MSRLARLLAAAALATGAVVAVAAPASAEATVSYTSAGASRAAPTASPQVAGTVTAENGCVIDAITLRVTTTEGHPVPADHQITGEDDGSQAFSWSPALTRNGRYRAVVEVTQRRTSVVASCGGTSTSTRDLWVEVPPQPPVLTRTQADLSGRTITLEWNPNPESDLIGYLIYRSHDGGAYEYVGGRAPGDPRRFTDNLADAPGGDYRYEVLALRPSADWYVDDGTERPPVASPSGAAASSGSARMPAPPAPTSGGGSTGGSSTGSGGSGTAGTGSSGGRTAAGGSGGLRQTGTVDFSAFAAELDRARRPGAAPGEFDPGFDEDLPFGPRTTIVREEVPGEALGEPIGTDQDRPTSLLMFAAGLLLTVFVMHLLWLKSEVDREPLEAITPDAMGDLALVPVTGPAAALPRTVTVGPASPDGETPRRVRRRPPAA